MSAQSTSSGLRHHGVCPLLCVGPLRLARSVGSGRTAHSLMCAELSADWRIHVLAVRGPVLVAIGVQVAQLLLRPIPSEVSPLDQALSGDAVRHPDHGTQLLMHTMMLSILGAALPVALAFGLPLVGTVLLRLPLRLSRSPPSRGLALGVLLVASLLSLAAVHALRRCLDAASPAPAPCARPPFLVCRHPISLSIVLLTAALTWLLPSLPGLVGSVWLAYHLDRQTSAEEGVLRSRFGAGWSEYAAEVPRWPGAPHSEPEPEPLTVTVTVTLPLTPILRPQP